MEYRRLGTTDLQVSSIGLGCVTFGREIGAAESFRVLDAALERGITLVDTAEVYGEGASEEVVGAWLADRKVRDRIVLATKVNGVLTRPYVLAAAEASLRRLRTDRVDLYQIHNWDATTPLDETLGAMEELGRTGKARFTGCSNVTEGQLAAMLARQGELGHARMQSVQPIYNLVHRELEAGLLPLCRRERLAVLTYSPLGAGFLTGKYRRGAPLPQGSRFDIKPGHQGVYFTEHGWRVLDEVRSLANEAGIPLPRLALAWVMHRPGVTSVLVGGRSPAHVEQALEADALALPGGLLERLDAAGLQPQG